MKIKKIPNGMAVKTNNTGLLGEVNKALREYDIRGISIDTNTITGTYEAFGEVGKYISGLGGII